MAGDAEEKNRRKMKDMKLKSVAGLVEKSQATKKKGKGNIYKCKFKIVQRETGILVGLGYY